MSIAISGLIGLATGLAIGFFAGKGNVKFRGTPIINPPVTPDHVNRRLDFELEPGVGTNSTLLAVRSYLNGADEHVNYGPFPFPVPTTLNLSRPRGDGYGWELTAKCDVQSPLSAGVNADRWEIFMITAVADPGKIARLCNGTTVIGTIEYGSDGLITATGVSVPGYSILFGTGPGTSSVTLEKNESGDVSPNVTIQSGDPGTVTTDIDGTADYPGVREEWTVTIGPNDGRINTSFGAVIDVVGGVIDSVSAPPNTTIVPGTGQGYTIVRFVAGTAQIFTTHDVITGDGTGGAIIAVSTYGVDPVQGYKERSTYTTGGPTNSVNQFSVNGGTFGMTSDDGIIQSLDTVAGFTCTRGGVGSGFAILEANSIGPVTDAVRVSGECIIQTLQQGS